jgi:mono/diheme cytochrome c family protein
MRKVTMKMSIKTQMKTKTFLAAIGMSLVAMVLFAGRARAQEEAPVNMVLGIQIWGQNCARCHNAPPPSAYRDEDWKIITHHMKIRANLTDPEIAAVLAYLQAVN